MKGGHQGELHAMPDQQTSRDSQSYNCTALFSTIASSLSPQTDKLSVHHYETLYDPYFSARSCDKVKFFEIGLGCGMGYGPGASSQVWPRLFLQGDIWFAEADSKCIKRYWNPKMPWRYVVGDQSNLTTLKEWLDITGGNFDFIVDDGGHTNPQMWNSFVFLFEKALKSGGTYFIEDLYYSRISPWHEGGIPGEDGATILDALLEWIDQLIVAKEPKHSRRFKRVIKKTFTFSIPKGVKRIDCANHMCAISKS